MGKRLRLRRADVCVGCGVDLSIGAEAYWFAESREVHCTYCAGNRSSARVDAASQSERDQTSGTTSQCAGIAGASAAREYEKRSNRERQRSEERVKSDQAWRAEIRGRRPILGRLAAAATPKEKIGPESRATKAWKTGAEGERRVAHALAPTAAVVLHDRRIPGTRANIDHIAIGPRGIYVIDTKRYAGRVERRDKGGFFRIDDRLYVNGRDRTPLIDKLESQCAAVRSVLDRTALTAAIHPVLCFVDADWPVLRKPIRIRGTTCLWPQALRKLVDADGRLSSNDVARLARRIEASLPPA